MNVEEPEDLLELLDDGTKYLSEYKDCALGIDSNGKMIYSADLIIAQLMERDDMSEEDAKDFYSYNISGSSDEVILLEVGVYEKEEGLEPKPDGKMLSKDIAVFYM